MYLVYLITTFWEKSHFQNPPVMFSTINKEGFYEIE